MKCCNVLTKIKDKIYTLITFLRKNITLYCKMNNTYNLMKVSLSYLVIKQPNIEFSY